MKGVAELLYDGIDSVDKLHIGSLSPEEIFSLK